MWEGQRAWLLLERLRVPSHLCRSFVVTCARLVVFEVEAESFFRRRLAPRFKP